MLYPQINLSRNCISLDGFWEFSVSENFEDCPKWKNGIDAKYEIAVPGSWNEQNSELMDFFETGWYQKKIWIPENEEGRRQFIRLGGANYHTKVWINGKFCGEHIGGHLPFEFEVTNVLEFNAINVVVIAVNAAFLPDTLPPGNVEDEMIVGFKGQYPNNYYDFYPYGGINRSVYLCSTNDVRITKIKTNTIKIDGNYFLEYKVEIDQYFSGLLVIKFDEIEKQYTMHKQMEIEDCITLKNPILWEPETPYLYELEVSLEKERKIDMYILPVGIRTIRVDSNRLLLNEKPVFLKGWGMHEDFPVLGKAKNEAVIINDINMLKWMHGNSIRTSHYPYSEEFLQYADRMGILIIGETPFVGFVNSHYSNTKIMDQVKKVLIEMIERDINHPSIIMWSLANEGDTFTSDADEFFENLYLDCKKEDNSRPATIVNCIDFEGDNALKHYDVISLNRYYGWYELGGRLEEAREKLSEHLDQCYKKLNKPIMITEFGADAVSGMHSQPPQMFSEEYQAEMLESQYKLLLDKPYVIGAHVWTFADFKTSQCSGRVINNHKGMFTRERKPKLSAHRMRQLWKE